MPEPERTDPHFELIFSRHAAEYHELVSCEDWKGNLPTAIARTTRFHGGTVVELGAGTGRLTLLLASLAARVLAFDRSEHMLDQASLAARNRGFTNITFGLADNRAVPLPDGIADVVIEGWSFGHTVSLAEGAWRIAANALLTESTRLLRPGGTLILIETLGTGTSMPEPPGAILPVFYGFLERQLGFASRWIRTDYRFPTLAEARRLVELFFGHMVDYHLAEGGQVIVPECTGIWHRAR